MREPADDLIEMSAEVREALSAGAAVVALESTIITHGMPYPANLTTAKEVEAIVRAEGATPATIALMDGRIRVGLDEAALERLASAKDAVKASRRDLAALLTRRATGGTTVAATMIAAHMAGIRIFATGGIGGVHRGAEETFDISADLLELGVTPVTVVCAGAKSILDIPKTLEVLETHGVPVIGYGCDDFPAFFSRSSGCPVDHRVDSPGELAGIIDMQTRLGLRTGILVGNPIPEEHALSGDAMEERIADACRDAERAGVSRKDLTPYLLTRINELTGGESLKANIALIRNNARVAAQAAVALSRLRAR